MTASAPPPAAAPEALLVSTCASSSLAVIRVTGRADLNHAGTLRALREVLLQGGWKRVRFDLEDCNYMDSAFAGVLARFARGSGGESGHPKIEFSGASEGIYDLLDALAVLPQLHLAPPELPADAESRPVDKVKLSKGELARLCADVHHELADLGGRQSGSLRTAAEFLKAEADRLAAAAAEADPGRAPLPPDPPR
jgi:ABC-type transporter Mla MlaB component